MFGSFLNIHNISKQHTGFTIIELMIVLAVLAVISSVVLMSFNLLRNDTVNASQEIATVLKLAQSDTLSSEGSSQYGVYFDTASTPNRYILFKGASYVARDASFDQIHVLPGQVTLSVMLGGGSEVVFDRLTGACDEAGTITLSSSSGSQGKTVYVASSGTVSFDPIAVPSDSARIKDSRHVHFDYSRIIDTATEVITLTFDGTVTQQIPISSNVVGGEIDWQGTVAVNGANQTVHIHTHRLNSPDTEFSIHRDRTENTKSLTMTISGDNTGPLATYSADGLTTSHTSIYVTNFAWQ